MAETKNAIGNWIKESWVTILVWVFSMGVMYATINSDRERITVLEKEQDRAITRIEAAEKQQTESRIFVANNTSRIDAIALESKQLQGTVGDIKTSIGIINTKLDNVVELLKKDSKP